LKNFVTSPSKKGSGFGYVNVTIGPYHNYQSDPYDGAIIAQRTVKQEHKKKMVSEKPFVTSSASHEYFNAFAGLNTTAKEGKDEKKKITVPFKPSSGYGYTINPYPSYEAPKVDDSKGIRLIM
jgi:hypothetical protein